MFLHSATGELASTYKYWKPGRSSLAQIERKQKGIIDRKHTSSETDAGSSPRVATSRRTTQREANQTDHFPPAIALGSASTAETIGSNRITSQLETRSHGGGGFCK